MAERDPLGPIHPGEVIMEEFLIPLGKTPDDLARAMELSNDTVVDVIEERAPITAAIAVRLEKALGPSIEFWLGLQHQYELEAAREAGRNLDLSAIPRLVAAE